MNGVWFVTWRSTLPQWRRELRQMLRRTHGGEAKNLIIDKAIADVPTIRRGASDLENNAQSIEESTYRRTMTTIFEQ